MTRGQFLSQLREGLKGLPQAQIDDIVADYDAHFSDASAAARSESEVAASLGDPVRLAKELRAEASIKRWEQDNSPKNFVNAGVALFALLALDVFILLPLVFPALIVGAVLVFVLFILGVVGLGLTAAFFRSGLGGAAVGLAGLGLTCGVVGVAAIILMLMGGAMRLLAHYARLHYRLLEKPSA